MKKLTKVLALVLALVLCSSILMACGKKGGENGTIAVIAKGETHAFWQAVKAGAEDAGAK